jgi:enoyl-CoA hydratase
MVEVDRDGAVATVRMDHGAVNAQDLELLEALAATFADLDAGVDVHAIVLVGNARAFSAGVDLKRLLREGDDYTRAFLAALSRAVLAPLRTPVPVVAAVNGHAVAGGAVLAAACDHAVLTDDPGTRVGLAELAAPIELMRRRLGAGLGEAVWLAGLFGPTEAHARGFVDEVVPAGDVRARAADVAARLAALPEATRRLTHDQLVVDVEAALAARAEVWDARVADAWCSQAVRGAIRAYVERTLGG